MRTIKLLRHTRFGDIGPGVRFRWGRWFEGQSEPPKDIYTRMRGNRYKDNKGRTWTTGARVAVEEVTPF